MLRLMSYLAPSIPAEFFELAAKARPFRRRGSDELQHRGSEKIGPANCHTIDIRIASATARQRRALSVYRREQRPAPPSDVRIGGIRTSPDRDAAFI